MTGFLIKRGVSNTDTCRRKTLENTRRQPCLSQGQRNRHLDLGLLAFRTARGYILLGAL
jgi:hypothetical protein